MMDVEEKSMDPRKAPVQLVAIALLAVATATCIRQSDDGHATSGFESLESRLRIGMMMEELEPILRGYKPIFVCGTLRGGFSIFETDEGCLTIHSATHWKSLREKPESRLSAYRLANREGLFRAYSQSPDLTLNYK
jgi:hypothetical protein